MNKNKLKLSRYWDLGFQILGLFTLLMAFFVLGALLINMFWEGLPRISWDFLTNFPSRIASRAGILSAWVGSILVMMVTAFISVPLGVGAGVYLEEYAPKNKLTAIIEISISNLAGVPSIVFGLMALGLFVGKMGLGQSIITAGLTLSLLILPIIIVTTRQSIRAIPVSVREAAYALGATKWEMVKDHVVPAARGGILTGMIIALSRAIGETAPLITIGALTYIAFLPTSPFSMEAPFINFDWLSDPFSVLPIQMFNWVSRPQEEFHQNASAAGVILVILTLTMNLGAIILRNHYRKKIKW
jgi:phosphate transport system permease protein